MTARPTLELLAGAPAPAGFEDLVALLARWSRPVAGPIADGDTDAPAATLAASPTAPGLDAALAAGRPVAIWSDEAPVDDRAACRISSRPLGDGAPSIVVSPHGLDLDRCPARMPFVRERTRRARGLPATMVVDVRVLEGADEVRIALELASAAIVTLAWAPLALALATPIVTDAATAASLGIVAGHQAEVIDAPAEQRAAAARIAADAPRAAALARAGRDLAERTLDRRRSAGYVAIALRLSSAASSDPRSILDQRLRELRSVPT